VASIDEIRACLDDHLAERLATTIDRSFSGPVASTPCGGWPCPTAVRSSSKPTASPST
jgi:hypothetical protein